jgi:hypothetical protein
VVEAVVSHIKPQMLFFGGEIIPMELTPGDAAAKEAERHGLKSLTKVRLF